MYLPKTEDGFALAAHRSLCLGLTAAYHNRTVGSRAKPELRMRLDVVLEGVLLELHAHGRP